MQLLESKKPDVVIKWIGRGVRLEMYLTRDHNPPHLHVFLSDGRYASLDGRVCRVNIPRFSRGKINSEKDIELNELKFYNCEVSEEVANEILNIFNETRYKGGVRNFVEMIFKWKGSNANKPSYNFDKVFSFENPEENNNA